MPSLHYITTCDTASNSDGAGGGSDDQDYKDEYQRSGRVFPLLPPYQGVDFGVNINKLKSSGDAGYFVVCDFIVVS